MRLKITLELKHKPQILPLNYKYPVSSWIYKTLAFSDVWFTEKNGKMLIDFMGEKFVSVI